MSEQNLLLSECGYPHTSARPLNDSIAGLIAMIPGEAEEMLNRVISERDAMKDREQWIHDNATTSGGGHGFTVTFFVPVDHEDIFCGIDAAIKLEQK